MIEETVHVDLYVVVVVAEPSCMCVLEVRVAWTHAGCMKHEYIVRQAPIRSYGVEAGAWVEEDVTDTVESCEQPTSELAARMPATS